MSREFENGTVVTAASSWAFRSEYLGKTAVVVDYDKDRDEYCLKFSDGTRCWRNSSSFLVGCQKKINVAFSNLGSVPSCAKCEFQLTCLARR